MNVTDLYNNVSSALSDGRRSIQYSWFSTLMAAGARAAQLASGGEYMTLLL